MSKVKTKEPDQFTQFYARKERLLAGVAYELVPILEEKQNIAAEGDLHIFFDRQGRFKEMEHPADNERQQRLIKNHHDYINTWSWYYENKHTALQDALITLRTHDYPFSANILSMTEKVKEAWACTVNPKRYLGYKKAQRVLKLKGDQYTV